MRIHLAFYFLFIFFSCHFVCFVYVMVNVFECVLFSLAALLLPIQRDEVTTVSFLCWKWNEIKTQRKGKTVIIIFTIFCCFLHMFNGRSQKEVNGYGTELSSASTFQFFKSKKKLLSITRINLDDETKNEAPHSHELDACAHQ